uniref:DNA mismatch repair proteins mutS family domain-containing protein n=1 Tax=viral metagenome TaxID=1070528 RepID=A0A6C0E6X6_9ZZZZ
MGHRDIDIDSIITALPTYTAVGAAALRVRLETPLTNAATLQARQEQIRRIKATDASRIKALRETLRDTEADTLSVADATTDKRHAEYYTQILWAPESSFSFLNNHGWLSELVVFFRTIFLPGVSILLPIFILAAPIIFFNLVSKEPLTVKGYFEVLQTSLKKTLPSILGKPRFEGTGGTLELGEQFAHVGVSMAMLGASIWNQVSAALALRGIVADMRRRADALTAFSDATVKLGTLFGIAVTPVTVTDQLGLFGTVWNSATAVRTLMDQAGELDMLAAIASTKRVCFPEYGSRLAIKDLYHPGIAVAERVYNTIEMGGDKKTHVLLTGPNRGGKSTLLKALGSAVLMAHTVGIVFGRQATVPVFDNIISALSPQDVIGQMSLFEAEIEFAKEVRKLKGATFLMMDEIFHGTNAHDGVEASQVFLDELYETPMFSVVSTHYMDLPKRYGGTKVQNLCMEASQGPESLVYTYRLKEGVNQFSSVREILRERGLLLKKTTQSLSK